eukprot:CAMPEP_0198367874 /NCGR_PEP_ID=MMETSP1450-20131203/155413_1 /TAXON_ID=753684 ORGANISM="Madagascaria erythrocladiodes, Strain CCMP3234" /NCGR_SAMPLE_ID=MMETSP1450 /ASSEMBLY_ACC=CAM_ASM_001115 /LENGTH=91 /DNA_ID=CAMNT_0044075367 /DNA_START=170 /DNA_END=445 /DNA_ORIENTATION=+
MAGRLDGVRALIASLAYEEWVSEEEDDEVVGLDGRLEREVRRVARLQAELRSAKAEMRLLREALASEKVCVVEDAQFARKRKRGVQGGAVG